MSLGTRKKFVDFQKILYDGVSIDSYEENNLDKSAKKQNEKNKKKNLKEKKFLGKKRDFIKLIKSNKGRKLKESGKKYENKKFLKNSVKSKKYPKSENFKNNEKIFTRNKNSSNTLNQNSKNENQLVTSHNKENHSEPNSNKNQKFYFKNEKLEKEEFSFLLNHNKEEFNHIGIDINPILKTLEKGNFSSINSDFTSLTMDLFSSTKFENSKPFKMIDYILNSDPKYLKSVNDKEAYEEIKKTIYNKKSNSTENSQIVFKSLYQYFKKDFSFSYIFKIFDSCDELIEKFYNPEVDANNPANTFGGFFFDKKDKFTYQNYLVDKLKNNYNNDWMREINDKEMIKSLIYLCNKHMKQSFKILNSNSENNFVKVLRENQNFLENSENEMSKGVNLLENTTFKMIKKKLVENKEFTRLLKKKLKRLLYFKDFSCGEENDPEDIKRIFVKLLELFTKSKEDDYEKILNKFRKMEIEKERDVRDTSIDHSFKNVKSFWIRFKILFYLVTLGNSNIKSYITDESFWRLIIDYVKEKKIMVHQSLKPVESFLNIQLKSRKGRKANEKESVQETAKKSNIIDAVLESDLQDSSKIFVLNSLDKNPNLKNLNDENISITNQIDINDNNKNNTFTSEMKANEFIKSEFNKNILTKITNREYLFEVFKYKTSEPKTKKRKRVEKSESVSEREENEKSDNETVTIKEDNVKENKEEEVVIKPKTVRVSPGFNPTGNIIINNYYNIINNCSDAQSLTIVQNFSHQFENDNNKIIYNDKKEEFLEENKNVIKRRKGRPKKSEIKLKIEEEQFHQDLN